MQMYGAAVREVLRVLSLCTRRKLVLNAKMVNKRTIPQMTANFEHRG
jgi:hypothetical protein